MARTPSKRWDTQIEKEYQKWMKGSRVDGWLFISRALLSRQHAAFVRLAKAIPSYGRYVDGTRYADVIKRSDLLAALQQGGKR